MPYYEYRCPANGRTLEVRHRMDHRIETWGELAALAGTDERSAPLDAPVERIMSVTAPVPGAHGSSDFRGCGTGCACAPD